MTSEQCLEHAAFHLRQAREYQADAEMALVESVGDLKEKHYAYFISQKERNERDARDWIAMSNGVNMK
jgi:hypothetical protein